MKYENGDIIFYLLNNKVHSASIMARMTVDNAKEPGYACNDSQKKLYEPWGLSGTFYNTCHGMINENDAFASKRELAEALIA